MGFFLPETHDRLVSVLFFFISMFKNRSKICLFRVERFVKEIERLFPPHNLPPEGPALRVREDDADAAIFV